MNQKLLAIAKQAADNLVRLVEDKETEILEAWNAAEQEAQLAEAAPKFRLALAITLDLDADKMETALSFSIRRKVTCEDAIPDPNQLKLPDIDTVTISADGRSATVTAAQFSKLAKMSGKKIAGLAKGSTMSAGV